MTVTIRSRDGVKRLFLTVVLSVFGGVYTAYHLSPTGTLSGADADAWGAGVVLGLGVCITRVVTQRKARSTRQQAHPPAADAIDPFTLHPPWRFLLQDALSTKRQFAQQRGQSQLGSIGLFVEQLGNQLDQAIADVAELAKRGDDLDRSIRQLQPTRLEAALERVQAGHGASNEEAQSASERSLRAQLASVKRLQEHSATLESTLRVDVTRLGEIVTMAAETYSSVDEYKRFDRQVEDLLRSLRSLRAAADEMADQ